MFRRPLRVGCLRLRLEFFFFSFAAHFCRIHRILVVGAHSYSAAIELGCAKRVSTIKVNPTPGNGTDGRVIGLFSTFIAVADPRIPPDDAVMLRTDDKGQYSGHRGFKGIKRL